MDAYHQEVDHKIVQVKQWCLLQFYLHMHASYNSSLHLLQTMNVLLISVANIIKRYKVHGALATFPGHGRKNKCNFRLNREIARKVEKRKKNTGLLCLVRNKKQRKNNNNTAFDC